MRLVDANDRVKEEGEQGHRIFAQLIARVDRPPIQRQRFEDPVEHCLAFLEETRLPEPLFDIFTLISLLHLDQQRE